MACARTVGVVVREFALRRLPDSPTVPKSVFLRESRLLRDRDLALLHRVLPNQDPVSRLDLQWDPLAGVVELPRADGHDLCLHRLLLLRVGDDDAALDLVLFGVKAPYQDSVVKWLYLHEMSS